MKRSLLLIASFWFLVSSRVQAAIQAEPELDLGALEPGSSSMPTPFLTRDRTGIVAAFADARVPRTQETQLFVQRLDDSGRPTSAVVLVSANVSALEPVVLAPTGDKTLLLWLPPSGDGGLVQGALVDADGSLERVMTLDGLRGLPTSVYCNAERCVAVVDQAFQEFDLSSGVVMPPFDVGSAIAPAPGSSIVAGLGSGYVSVRGGTRGTGTAAESVLMSAALGFDHDVQRPFELVPVIAGATPAMRFVPGAENYLLGFSRKKPAAAGDELWLAALDRNGQLQGASVQVPSPGLAGLDGWASVWAEGSYRILIGGNPQHYVSMAADGQLTAPTELRLDAEREVAISQLVSAGSELLVGFYSMNNGLSSLGPAQQPNLALLGVDGGVHALSTLGPRPPQQAGARLIADGDRFWLAYDEWNGRAPFIRYTLLDRNGAELGIQGQLSYPPLPFGQSASAWTVAPTDGGFLIHVQDIVSFVDASGVDAHVEMQLPLAAADSAAVAWGGGVLLVMGEFWGQCGEDCGWSDVGARRFARDGTALDAAELLAPLPERLFVSRRAPSTVWDGTQFVAVAVENGALEFRRIGADGALIDADWRYLSSSSAVYEDTAYRLATHDGTTLVAWATAAGLRAARIFADGASDPVPLEIDPATSSRLAVTHDGSRFLVAWEFEGTVHAAAIESDGSVHSGSTLTRPDSEPRSHGPALASLGDGTALLAYHRFDERPSQLTSRLKLRLVADGPAEIGSVCSLDTDCAAGFCAAGVCCNERCDAASRSCAAVHTGAANGLCGPVNDAADTPDGGVPPGAVSCDDDGACPPDFTCEPLKRVCIPPARPCAPTPEEGCAFRAGSGKPPAWDFGALLLALCASLAVRRRSLR